MRKTDKTLGGGEGEDVVVCLPGHGQGGSILVHVGTNNADLERTTTIVQRYKQLVGKLEKTRVEQDYSLRNLASNGRKGSNI